MAELEYERGLEWDTPMYRLAVGQLDQTAELMGLDPNIWQRLRTPQRALVVSFPFRADNYSTVTGNESTPELDTGWSDCLSRTLDSRATVLPKEFDLRRVETTHRILRRTAKLRDGP